MENHGQTPAQNKPTNTQPVMHTFQGKTPHDHTLSTGKVLSLLVVVAFLGVGSGFALSHVSAKTGRALLPTVGETPNNKIYGSNDTKTFKDTAEGTLEEGGINGEGQYHLVRTGGDGQNVYLTSSIVDLSQFVGKKVKIWGETQQGQYAGWLMDVGRVQVL